VRSATLRRRNARGNKTAFRRLNQHGRGPLNEITPAEILEPLLWLLDAVGVSRREVISIVRALPPLKLREPVIVVKGKLEYWSRILDRWAADTKFLGSDGRPRDLPFSGGDSSFSDLAALELPHERPAECRDNLLAIGSIVQLPNKKLRWRERSALAHGVESGVILADEYLRPLRALLLALQANLLQPEVAFQRAVSGFEISSPDMAELGSFVARHGSALLELVDDWLSHRRQVNQRLGRSRRTKVRPYLGLYLSSEAEGVQRIPQAAKRRSRK